MKTRRNIYGGIVIGVLITALYAWAAGGHYHIPKGAARSAAYQDTVEVDPGDKFIAAHGTIDTVDINAGAVDGTTVGSATPSTGAFTTLAASGDVTLTGNTMSVAPVTSFSTGMTAASATLTTADINGGTVDGTAIGAGTPSTGAFTTLAASGDVTLTGNTMSVAPVTNFSTGMTAASATLTTADINAGTMDNVAIGSSTPAAGAFTTLAANGDVTLTGNTMSVAPVTNFSTGMTAASATLTTADINGGTIDGVTLGASVRGTAAVTTLNANGAVILGDGADAITINGSSMTWTSPTTTITNLNADKLDSKSEAEFADLSEDENVSGDWTFEAGALTTWAAGASANVSRLNVDSLYIDDIEVSASAANLNAITDNSMADALHRHSELSASDGTPDAALALNAAGGLAFTGPQASFSNGLTLGGALTVTGAATFSSGFSAGATYHIVDYRGHAGDPDTYDGFDAADSYKLIAGGIEAIVVKEGTQDSVRLAGNGADVDINLGDGLFIRGDTQQVGIGHVPGRRFSIQDNGGNESFKIENEHGSAPQGMLIDFSGASANDEVTSFIYAEDSTAPRFIVYSSGSIYSAKDLDAVNATFSGAVSVNTTLDIGGAATLASVDINGGAIDETTVGTTTPSSGAFTTLDASGNVSFTGPQASFSNGLTVGGKLNVHGMATLGNAAADTVTFTAENLWVGDDAKFGLGGSTAYIEFKDQEMDAINFINANVGIGITTPIAQIHIAKTGQATLVLDSHQNSQGNPAWLGTRKSRDLTIGSHAIVENADDLMVIDAQGSDGTSYISAARIFVEVDGTPGTNDVPGRLIFMTTLDGESSPTERMRIDNAGNISIGQTTFGTGAATVMAFSNGTSPSTSPANAVQIWAADVAGSSELLGRDEDGNVAPITSNVKSYPASIEPSTEYPYVTRHTQVYAGVETYIAMHRLAELVQVLAHEKGLLAGNKRIIEHRYITPQDRAAEEQGWLQQSIEDSTEVVLKQIRVKAAYDSLTLVKASRIAAYPRIQAERNRLARIFVDVAEWPALPDTSFALPDTNITIPKLHVPRSLPAWIQEKIR